MKYILDDWRAEGKRRFGCDAHKWLFRCPMCGHVASVQDFLDAGAVSEDAAYQECLGRYTGKGSPKEGDDSGCDWAAYGLLGIPKEHDIIVTPEGREVHVYPFADLPDTTGAVFLYGMWLRGFSPGCQPKEGLVERRDSANKRYYDTITGLPRKRKAVMSLTISGSKNRRARLRVSQLHRTREAHDESIRQKA